MTLADAAPWAAAAVAGLAFATALMPSDRRRRRPDAIGPRALLTGNEREFFGRLSRALPGHRIFPQVAMSAILTSAKGRSRFDRKVVDFVVCDHAMRVVALVELDDRTHERRRDAARDAMTREAGYRTVRYRSRSKPDAARIAADVLGRG